MKNIVDFRKEFFRIIEEGKRLSDKIGPMGASIRSSIEINMWSQKTMVI